MDNQELYREIKSQIKIEDYARRMGYSVEKKGRYFSLKEHDSVIIDPRKNCFWRNSEPGSGKSIGRGGSIIDFVCMFKNVSLHEALKELSMEVQGRFGYLNHSDHCRMAGMKKEGNRPSAETILALPDQDVNMRNVFAYLIQTRCIDQRIVQAFVDRHMLYQDQNKNCVFVSYDRNDPKHPVFACRRGTNTRHPFYGDVAGCDYQQCFYYSNHADRLYVTESVIDTMSVMSLKDDHDTYDYLALAGVGKLDVIRTYIQNPRIKEVWLGTDQDEHGRLAARMLADAVRKKRPDIRVVMDLPDSPYKDWNDVLKSKHMERNKE